MINHTSHLYVSSNALDAQLSDSQLQNYYESASATLVQIYSHSPDPSVFDAIYGKIKARLPYATIVGASTIGEIQDGKVLIDQTTIDFTFFESTQIRAFSSKCSSSTGKKIGAWLGDVIGHECDNIAGVMLLATPICFDTTDFINSFSEYKGNYPVFGGGAGSYESMSTSLIYVNGIGYESGIAGIVFCSEELEIFTDSYLGWRSLSKPMKITGMQNLTLDTIDNKPAFDIYEKYLEIKNDDAFFINALEFPLLVERNGQLLARVPVFADEERRLTFISELHQGEEVSLGYGDLEEILRNARDLHQRMNEFAPSVIFLFTCGCRRFLMQDDVDIETSPFQSIAPTAGFYTYGEYLGDNEISFLNSTLVSVGMREGDKTSSSNPDHSSAWKTVESVTSDPYANQHTRVVSRLLTFIKNLSGELIEAQSKLEQQAKTDHLTRLNNRISLDEYLNECHLNAKRYQTIFSVIMIDIDHFKRVNDEWGHLVGDQLLVEFAQRIKSTCRETDLIGRWGGEEFLIIAPNTDADHCVDFAHKIKQRISEQAFETVGHKTVSIGVATWQTEDTVKGLLERADQALYQAKKNGRNQVQVQKLG